MNVVRVLIAEDNEDHMVLATLALKSVGVPIQIIEAKDGQEALDYLFGRGDHAGAPLPNLVLLDLAMPRKTGLQVLEEVKSDERLSRIPVVMLTSSDRPEDVNAAYDAGANCYVQKSRGMRRLTEFWTATVNLPLN